ncbi:hypothetical protein E1295_20740 [Nonomuraea mesophila]|uniref:Uncharacterized protein n=1 Tax=Nonomuraea mesophila TaxID=2530382 RepID=A0A4R5FF24_9ACTN|nr:hypothetical protein [Nonomuraea mesophila]TDE49047.1 hypothetical protein E1295_20740 [Nonomuraea mesophila]
MHAIPGPLAFAGVGVTARKPDVKPAASNSEVMRRNSSRPFLMGGPLFVLAVLVTTILRMGPSR